MRLQLLITKWLFQRCFLIHPFGFKYIANFAPGVDALAVQLRYCKPNERSKFVEFPRRFMVSKPLIIPQIDHRMNIGVRTHDFITDQIIPLSAQDNNMMQLFRI